MLKIMSVAAVVFLMGVQAVRADEPIISEFQTQHVNLIIADCGGGFQIIENSTISFRRMVFFTHEGGLDRIQLHVEFEGTFTNSVTGYTLTDAPDAFTLFVDLGSGELAFRGLITSIEVPGEGVVVLDAGNIVFGADGEVTVHGPHEFSEGGVAVLCAALSP